MRIGTVLINGGNEATVFIDDLNIRMKCSCMPREEQRLVLL